METLTAIQIELYREYAANEVKSGKEDFLTFSVWREQNKNILE